MSKGLLCISCGARHIAIRSHPGGGSHAVWKSTVAVSSVPLVTRGRVQSRRNKDPRASLFRICSAVRKAGALRVSCGRPRSASANVFCSCRGCSTLTQHAHHDDSMQSDSLQMSRNDHRRLGDPTVPLRKMSAPAALAAYAWACCRTCGRVSAPSTASTAPAPIKMDAPSVTGHANDRDQMR